MEMIPPLAISTIFKQIIINCIEAKKNAYCGKILLKFLLSTSRGTKDSVETGDIFISAHLKKSWQVTNGKAYEVQIAFVSTWSQVLQLQVQFGIPVDPQATLEVRNFPVLLGLRTSSSSSSAMMSLGSK